MAFKNWAIKNLRGDIYIWAVVFLLSIFGILAVYSSTGILAYQKQGGNTQYYLVKHLGMLIVGLIIMYVSHWIDYRYYSRLAQILLWISIPLLVYTLFFGSNINMARRWISLPIIGLSFQTSDLAKLSLIMYIARFLSRRQDKVADSRQTFYPIVGSIVVIFLLIAPANLSTALVLFFTCLILLYLGRIPLKFIFSLIGICVIGAALMIGIISQSKSQGRMGVWKNRLESYLGNGDADQNYQNIQAKIAIAKGKLFGVGSGKSLQRNFLPSPYADFIFAIIIEEYGLLGAVFLISLYLFLLFRSIRLVYKSPKAFGALLSVGLTISLVIQAFLNMGVAVNIFPVTGLPLPLVSMGGTSILFTSLAFGIILSVSRNIEEKPIELDKHES